MTLADEVDIARGDMIARAANLPKSSSNFEAMLVWTGEEPLDFQTSYLLKHTTSTTKCVVKSLRYVMDVNQLSRMKADSLDLNQIGRVQMQTQKPIFCDAYEANRITGAFILIDPRSHATVAAGMITDPQIEPLVTHGSSEFGALLDVSHENRLERNAHQPLTIWMTGLSGAGKTTLARKLERIFFDRKNQVVVIDGDSLRQGLCKDLGFSNEDREENIRRAAEMAKFLNDQGIIAICSLISPLISQRQIARDIIGSERFFELHIAATLDVCEKRDPKGLYRKARSGALKQFTGLDAPYEAPVNPDLRLDTGAQIIEESLAAILKAVESRR